LEVNVAKQAAMSKTVSNGASSAAAEAAAKNAAAKALSRVAKKGMSREEIVAAIRRCAR